MPIYELSLVFKILPRDELASALKRIGCLLMDKGAQIHKLENLGTRDLPLRLTAKEQSFHKGSYFVYNYMSSARNFQEVWEACKRDVDVLKHHIGYGYEDLNKACTLNEEMQSPALRQSVKDLLEKSKKHKDRTKPFYWHVKEYNYYDIYM